MTKRHELETAEDRVAWDLCCALGVEPFSTIPDPCSSRFVGYEGDYYMNWARERVNDVGLIFKLMIGALGEETRKQEG